MRKLGKISTLRIYKTSLSDPVQSYLVYGVYRRHLFCQKVIYFLIMMGTDVLWLVLIMYSIHVVVAHEFILRPINGNENEGYVEAKINGTWGIMTRRYDRFDETTAGKLCIHFGFGSTGFSTVSYVALNLTNNALSWDKLMSCSANQTDVNECVTDEWTNNGHWVTTLEKGWTRLHCYAFEVTDVRLAGGLYPHGGRFEVKVGGRWGLTCEFPEPLNGYNSVTSYGGVMCSMLGFTDAWEDWIKYSVRFSNTSIPITDVWMTTLRCSSDVTNINQCSFMKGAYHPDCIAGPRKCQPIQLLNGTTPSSGIIAAGLFGQKHIFCGASEFNGGAANVTCSLLGHHGSHRITGVNRTNVNSINVSILCEGSEQSLEMCDIIQQGECQDSSVLYIECFDDQIDIIPIGNKSNEGAFTFKFFDTWWLLKGRAFSNTTAKTLCNMLGHGLRGYSNMVERVPGDANLSILYVLDDLECSGNETNIAQCRRSNFDYNPCYRCFPAPPNGFAVLYCDECPPGYWGKFCSECNCNNRSLTPCDIETGECFCMTGWSGISCEIDQDECNVPMLCPNNSVCVNTPGSYQCDCNPGYIKTGGHCSLIIQKDEPSESDSNLLIIILSSAVGGLLLISVIATCCMCMYKRRATTTRTGNKTANKTKDAGHGNAYSLTSTVKSEDYSTIDVPTLPARQVTKTEPRTEPYATIDDTQKPTSSRSKNEDARPDVPRRGPVNKSEKKNDDSKHIADIKDYDYPYPAVIPTDDTGYIKLTGNPNNNPNGGYMNSSESGSVALPTDEDGYLRAGNNDNMQAEYRNSNYQKLNPKSRQEHDYGRIKY